MASWGQEGEVYREFNVYMYWFCPCPKAFCWGDLEVKKQDLLRAAYNCVWLKSCLRLTLLLTIPQHNSFCCLSLIRKPWPLVPKLLAPLSEQKAASTIHLETGSKFSFKRLTNFSQGSRVLCEQTVHLPWLCVSIPQFSGFLFLFFLHWLLPAFKLKII